MKFAQGKIDQFKVNLYHFFATSLCLASLFFIVNQLHDVWYKYSNIIENAIYFIIVFGLVSLVLGLVILRKLWCRLVRSNRRDIGLSIATPFLIAAVIAIFRSVNSCQVKFCNFFLDALPLPAIIFSAFIFCTYFYLLKKLLRQEKEVDNLPTPLFISDDPYEESHDLLEMEEDALIFADQVLNNTRKESLVFGIDAPWGAGKTSYIKYCKKYWVKKDVIIVDFEPLRFDSGKDIFKALIEQIIVTIQTKYYYPEVTTSIEKYAHILTGLNFSILNFNVEIPFKKSSEAAYNRLKDNLALLDKRIVVIVDDLDRLSLDRVKTILDVVKKSLGLLNISYILCYDTANINSFYSELRSQNILDKDNRKISGHKEVIDNEKITEYLEKIVNIKKTLIIPRGKLQAYFLLQVSDPGDDYRYFSNEAKVKIEQATETLFSADTFYQYNKYLGDLRKIKRFLNTLRLQIVPKLDLSVIDIDFLDLLNLLLIYINYPHIFRKICETETEGGQGFFSLIYDYDAKEHKSKYVQSKQYLEYRGGLTGDEQFLLDRIFKIRKEDELDDGSIAQSASFNGVLGTGRNLEAYIKLITRRSVSNPTNEYNFHKKNVDNFFAGKQSIETILNTESAYIFSEDNDAEKNRILFFKVLFSDFEKISYDSAQKIIVYILQNINAYSTLRDDPFEIQAREGLVFRLVRILEKRGWKDKENHHSDNNLPNIEEIADWIYGEKIHTNQGVLSSLLNQPNILGLYDLLTFRLTCSADRGSDLFNLERALIAHAKIDPVTNGSVEEIAKQEMREISQYCFSLIKQKYFDNDVNILEQIDHLSDVEMISSAYAYTQKNKSIDRTKIDATKKGIAGFIIYQLTNYTIKQGVGCGRYDAEGVKDNAGIRKAVNEYLFRICFSNAGIFSKKGSGYFIRYLLSNLKFDGREAVSDINYVCRTLDESMLKQYWKDNGEKIKYFASVTDGIVYAPGYTATFKEDFPPFVRQLDELVNTKQKQDPN